MRTSKGTIKYKIISRKNPQEPDGAPVYYAKAVQDRTMEFEDFVSHMSDHNSPFSRGVIHGVLTDMLDCLQELVLDGKSVRLGDLGLFSVGLTGRTAATQKDWDPSLVEGVKLNVRNTKTWSNAELRKRCRLSELSAYDDGTDDEDETGTGGQPSVDDGEDDGPVVQ